MYTFSVKSKLASAGQATAPAKAASAFAGMRIGVNQYGEEVRVKREVGSTQGYDDRLQAIAVARLGGADPSVVVQSTDGKWHALETTANFYEGKMTTAADTPTLAVYGLPSSASIADVRQKVNELKARLAELDAMRKSGGDPKAIDKERDQVSRISSTTGSFSRRSSSGSPNPRSSPTSPPPAGRLE
jgi:hypothetical protein